MTTAGGSIYMCFASSDEAQKYAYEIEKRYIKRDKYDSEGKLTYKDDLGSNQEKDYKFRTDREKINFTRRVAENSKHNVEKAYFDASDPATFRSFNDLESFDEQFDKEIEKLSTNKSVRAFPSEEEKRKLLDNDQPIINNYTFISVGDYDVNSIKYHCMANDVEGNIILSEPVKNQLTVSSIYEITEKDEYGDAKTYNTIFLNENQTRVKLDVITNGNAKEIELNDSDKYDVSGDVVLLKELTNDFDSQTIIRITSESSQYSQEICTLIGNVNGLALYKKGRYGIELIDRAGNKMTFIITISGNSSYTDIASDGYKSYSDIFNENHIIGKIREDG